MPILNVTPSQTGLEGVVPKVIFIDTNDTLSQVTTANYLNSVVSQNIPLSENDMALVSTKTSPNATATELVWLRVSKSGNNFSLVPPPGSGSVTLPTKAGHIAVYSDTIGTLSEDANPAINEGSIQAGKSGVAGHLASFPATPASGSLQLVGVANGGDVTTTISNSTMGQSSTVSIPDPASPTANFLVSPGSFTRGHFAVAGSTNGVLNDSGAKILAGLSSTFAGGSASTTFTINGLISGSPGAAVILTSTNPVYIVSAVPSANTLTVTFSADPGANTVISYIYATVQLL